jgi:hypothetical protein
MVANARNITQRSLHIAGMMGNKATSGVITLAMTTIMTALVTPVM